MVTRRRRPRSPRQINLRVDEPLRRKLEATAKERQISTNQLMNQLLETGLEELRSPSRPMMKGKTIAEDIAEAVAKRLGWSKVPPWPPQPRTLVGSASSQQHKKEGGDE
jgi:hypothetical protein